jgi:hypothetical protein
MKANPIEVDPVLVETVERALLPYKQAYPPEMVEHFRQEALMLLASHHYASALVEQLKPPPVNVEESGEVPTEEAALEADPDRRSGIRRRNQGGVR